MTTGPLRVGVIGVGRMGAQHVSNLVALERATLSAVMDLDLARASEAAIERAEVFSSAEDLIQSPDVDAIVVASPHDTHAALAIACIEAGKPVLCEKPLALSVGDALAVVQAERRSGRRLVQVGFMREFDAPHIALRDKLRSGWFGAGVSMRGLHINPSAGYARPVDDVLAASVVHDIHSARWLLQTEAAEVSVRWAPVPDAGPWSCRYVTVSLAMRNGCIATLECDAESVHGYEVEVEVACEGGTVSTAEAAGYERTVTPGWQERFAAAYEAEMAAWVEGVLTGETAGPGAEDGYAAQATVEACIQSARSGQAVAVDLNE